MNINEPAVRVAALVADMSASEPSALRLLVVDEQGFQRRLTMETLRGLGRVRVDHVTDAQHCLAALPYVSPHILFAAWDERGEDGLALTKRIRAGEAGDAFRRLPVVLLTDRGRPSEIELARRAGVDELVQRPFSTAALIRRVQEVRARRRDFVESTAYVGPCRRRRRDGGYDGPRRRLFDANEARADAPELQIRKGLARMYVERLRALLEAASQQAPDAMRELALTSGQLSALAADMNDRMLASSTSSLFNYLKGVGMDAPLNTDVVAAHLDAVHQLAELPNYKVELRQTVSQQLAVMVTKKLRQAGAAA